MLGPWTVPILLIALLVGFLFLRVADWIHSRRPKCTVCGHDHKPDLCWTGQEWRCFDWKNCGGYRPEGE